MMRAILVSGFTWALWLFLLMVLTMALPMASIAQEPADWKEKQTVSAADQSEQVTTAKELLRKTLATVVPPKGENERSLMADGRYVLCVDLCGKRIALVDLAQSASGETEDGDQIGLGFSVWNGKTWDPKGFWRIGPVWRPGGWRESETDRLPATPSVRPFWIEKVHGSPIIIVAGALDRWGQAFYVLDFDRRVGELRVLARSDRKPETVDGYLRLLRASGRKADWAEWAYWGAKGKSLGPFGTWKTDVSDCENPKWTATAYDEQNRPTVYLIETNQPDCRFKISRDDEPYAKVKIHRPNAPNIGVESEEAYLFEKLTNMPRRFYPPDYSGAKPKRLEAIASITVIGSSEAIKVLSPGKAQ